MVLGRILKTVLLGISLVGLLIPTIHADESYVFDNNLISDINSGNSLWNAGHNQFTNMSITDAQQLMGVYDLNLNDNIRCDLCEMVVGFVEKEIAGEYVESKIEKALQEVCNIVPPTFQSSCNTIISTYTPELIEYISEKLSPNVVCNYIQFCDSNHLSTNAWFISKLSNQNTNNLECDVCNYLIQFIEKELAGNYTVEKIEEVLEDICHVIPSYLENYCDNFVEKYTPLIINALINRETPQVVCSQIGLCTNELILSLPDNFDWRKQNPGCMHPVRDQMKCGSCWAFSASEVLSDRFCLASQGKINVILSPQTLVSCDKQNMGCNGGYLNKAWQFIQQNGITSDSCMPYTSGSGDSGSCPTQCADGTTIKYYKASSYKQVIGVTNIQNELLNGPLQVAFSVYQDFMSYKSGIYHHVSGSLLGGHAVELIGWGTENGVDYWTIKNSWANTWGEQGFFRIVRGKDECGIESNVYTGVPLVSKIFV
jgi:cathepsin B